MSSRSPMHLRVWPRSSVHSTPLQPCPPHHSQFRAPVCHMLLESAICGQELAFPPRARTLNPPAVAPDVHVEPRAKTDSLALGDFRQPYAALPKHGGIDTLGHRN